jgi:hypothetical protein
MKNELIFYSLDHINQRIEVQLSEDSVWLNRTQLALLFGRDIKTIGKHLNNALKEELFGLPVVAKFATTGSDGKIYQVERVPNISPHLTESDTRQSHQTFVPPPVSTDKTRREAFPPWKGGYGG